MDVFKQWNCILESDDSAWMKRELQAMKTGAWMDDLDFAKVILWISI